MIFTSYSASAEPATGTDPHLWTYKSTVARRIDGDLSESLVHSHAFPSVWPKGGAAASTTPRIYLR